MIIWRSARYSGQLLSQPLLLDTSLMGKDGRIRRIIL